MAVSHSLQTCNSWAGTYCTGSTCGCHGQPWLFSTSLLLWCWSGTSHDASMQECWRATWSFPIIIGEAPHVAIPTSSCCLSLRWHSSLLTDLQLSPQGPVFPLQLVDLGTHLADDLQEVRVSLHGLALRSKASHREAPKLEAAGSGP